MIENLLTQLSEYVQIVLTTVFLLLFLIGRTIANKLISRHARRNNINRSRMLYTRKFFNLLIAAGLLTLLAITWDINFRGLSIYFASVVTVLGVALFAQWSILSNVTASIILFLYYTYKIGAEVKIIDGEDSIRGKIVDITLFYIKIEIQDGSIISYPNSLAMQRPILQYGDDQPKDEL